MIKALTIYIILQLSSSIVLLVSNLSTTTLKSPSNQTLVYQTYHGGIRDNYLGDGTKWLWIKGGTSWAAGQSITVQSLFTSNCSSNPGFINITADDAFTLYLNKEKIGTGASWSTKYSFNVEYKKGTNNLTVVATNVQGGSPAALIFKVSQNTACSSDSSSNSSNTNTTQNTNNTSSNSTDQNSTNSNSTNSTGNGENSTNSTNQNSTNSNSTNGNSTNSNSTNNSTTDNNSSSNSTNQTNTSDTNKTNPNTTNQTNQTNSSTTNNQKVETSESPNLILVLGISIPLATITFISVAYNVLKKAPEPQPTENCDTQKKTQNVGLSEEGIQTVQQNMKVDKL